MLNLTYNQVDKGLKKHLSKYGIIPKFKNSVQLKGVLTNRNCFVNGKTVFGYTYNNKSRKVTQKPLIVNYKYNDPKKAVLLKKRSLSWGKTLVVENIGNTINEVFDYLVFLILQTIDSKKFPLTKKKDIDFVKLRPSKRFKNSIILDISKPNIKPTKINSSNIIYELEKYYKLASPEVKEVVSEKIERSPIAQRVKRITGYKCMICEKLNQSPYSFKKTNGEYYIETHHVIPVSQRRKGLLGVSNIITVCANHHRQLHYGNVTLWDTNDKKFDFEIDGKSIVIKKITLS
jgi:hypothetical protein